MVKRLFSWFVIFVLFLAAQGCSKHLDDGDVIVMPQKNPQILSYKVDDNVITFNSDAKAANNVPALNNSSQNSFSNYYFSPPGKVLNTIPGDSKWLDFEVYDRYIYLIGKSNETAEGFEYGKDIIAFDTEGQSHIKTFGSPDSAYIAIAQFKGFLYAYDVKKGEIHKYNPNGELKDKAILKPGIQISKMKFSGEGWLAAMANIEGRSSIVVYDESFKSRNVLNPLVFTGIVDGASGYIPNLDISILDFDIYDKDLIILKASNGILYLYDFKQGVLKKKRFTGNECGLLCYSSNILYWTSEERLGVFKSNSTQMAYVASPDILGRMVVNSGFPWNTEEVTLDEWTLEPLEIPGDWLGSVHQRIKSWGRFVYILDYKVSSGGTDKDLESVIIRVEK